MGAISWQETQKRRRAEVGEPELMPIAGVGLEGAHLPDGGAIVTGPCGLRHVFTRKEAARFAAWLAGKDD